LNQAISLQFGASNGGFGMRCRRILPNFRSLEAVGGSFESLCYDPATIASIALVSSIQKEWFHYLITFWPIFSGFEWDTAVTWWFFGLVLPLMALSNRLVEADQRFYGSISSARYSRNDSTRKRSAVLSEALVSTVRPLHHLRLSARYSWNDSTISFDFGGFSHVFEW